MENNISKYQTVSRLSDRHDVFLVRCTDDDSMYVRKDLEIFSMEVYDYLYHHPIKHIPRIIELIPQDDCLTVIEEYVQGESLADCIEKEGVFPVDNSIAIINELCQIVKRLHECQPPIIHRDIKPENIIITASAEVILLDMNAAKFFRGDNEPDTYLLGTHGYAAPEQYGFGNVSAASDIYAIGKVLCMLTTGSLNGQPPKEVQGIISKCTEIDPQKRYQSVDELLGSLIYEDRRESLDYNKLPGFRSHYLFARILGLLMYVCFFLIISVSNFEGITGTFRIWCNRIMFAISVMAPFLFIRNYRYIWRRVGIDQITNRWLRYLMIALVAIGMLFLILEISGLVNDLIITTGG